MDITHYSAVIRMTLADCAGQDIDTVTDRIVQSIRIADLISGGTQPASVVAPVIPINTALQQSRNAGHGTAKNMKEFAGVFLVGSAPPVAGVTEDPLDEPTDQWESRPGKGDSAIRMTNHLQGILPPSITVTVPGILEPLTLVRSISGPSGMPFVHVGYCLAGQELGPRVTLMNTTREFSVDEIIADVMIQAGSLYRKDKVKLEPKALAFAGVPSDMEIQRMAVNGDSVSGTDARLAREDAASWASNRPDKWR